MSPFAQYPSIELIQELNRRGVIKVCNFERRVDKAYKSLVRDPEEYDLYIKREAAKNIGLFLFSEGQVHEQQTEDDFEIRQGYSIAIIERKEFPWPA